MFEANNCKEEDAGSVGGSSSPSASAMQNCEAPLLSFVYPLANTAQRQENKLLRVGKFHQTGRYVHHGLDDCDCPGCDDVRQSWRKKGQS